MANELEVVKVAPDSELGALVDRADKRPILLEKDGVCYRLTRGTPVEEEWPEYDAEKMEQVLTEAAAYFANIDTDALIANIYRWREEGSRPNSAPYCPIC